MRYWQNMKIVIVTLLLLLTLQYSDAFALLQVHQPSLWPSMITSPSFVQQHYGHSTRSLRATSNNDDPDQMKQKAQELREEIRKMEEQLSEKRSSGSNNDSPPLSPQQPTTSKNPNTLDGKTVLVTGANGRLGSMVCRYLLRNFPKTKVVAVVHYVGENSPTARGYARLSYEVGAEDGIGQIGPAWSSSDERTATFEYDTAVMQDYNLQNLRLVECELLDPVQCQTIVEDAECDAIIWCATDFNANQPRAVASLDVALLFRAVTRPTKGRVEVEGLQNMLQAFKLYKQNVKWKQQQQQQQIDDKDSNSGPLDFVLVSIIPEAYLNTETPFGSFLGIKSQGETMLQQDFPSISHTILQFGRFDDNFVAEGLNAKFQNVATDTGTPEEKERRRMNRRDAASFAANALLQRNELGAKTVQVWTDP